MGDKGHEVRELFLRAQGIAKRARANTAKNLLAGEGVAVRGARRKSGNGTLQLSYRRNLASCNVCEQLM